MYVEKPKFRTFLDSIVLHVLEIETFQALFLGKATLFLNVVVASVKAQELLNVGFYMEACEV